MMGNPIVLITGGAGFIGTNLARQLLDEGYDLRVLDNFSQVGPEMVRKATGNWDSDRVELIEGDIREPARLSPILEGVDAVVHLAAFTDVPASVDQPETDVETNARGTFHVLESARKANVSSFVFASSNAVVGEVDGAVNETCVPAPLAPYGASKLYGEALCSVYWNTYDLHTTSLRFANAYGPYSGHKTSVVAKFLRRASRGKNLEIYGDGKQTRDFIHAEDIARALSSALECQHPGGQVYQVATARETKILDLAGWVQELANDSGISVNVTHEDPREGEIRYNYSDIDKAKNELNWKPRRRLRSALKTLWEREGVGSVTTSL